MKYFPFGAFTDAMLNAEFLQISRVVNDEGERWDDLRFPVTAINLPGQASDPDIEASTGMFLFAASGTELIFGVAQLPHAWKEQSVVKPHIHWCKTTSAGGDVVWRLDLEVVNNGSVTPFTYATTSDGVVAAGTPDGDTANECLISTFDAIDMTGLTVSSLIFWKLSRIGSDGSDTYGADARLFEFDIHYQTNTPGGSEEEYSK